jgi:hypothetical protein
LCHPLLGGIVPRADARDVAFDKESLEVLSHVASPVKVLSRNWPQLLYHFSSILGGAGYTTVGHFILHNHST